MPEQSGRLRHPLYQLPDSELEFVLRLVLASGSLKELAQVYRVSYPTIRSTLDRVIARLRELEAGRTREPMIELLGTLVEEGQLTPGAARKIRACYRKITLEQKEKRR